MESEYESDSYDRGASTSRRSEKLPLPVKNLPVEALEKDIVGLILQYLDNAGYTNAVHALEKDAKYYFDLKYLKQLFIDGEWIELVNYLKSFLTKEENTRFYFEILRHKFFDALDKGDKAIASKILKDEFWTFYELDENNYDPSSSGAQSFNEWSTLLHFDDFRKHPTIKWHSSAKEMRVEAFPTLEKYLREKIPQLSSKTTKPQIPDPKRLRTLLNQAISFQVTCCVSKNKPTVVNTLFVDHKCNEPNPPYGNYCFEPQLPPKKFSVPSTPNFTNNNGTATSNNNNNSSNGSSNANKGQGRGPKSPMALQSMPAPSTSVKRPRESEQNQVSEFEPPVKKRKTKFNFPENLLRSDITWPNNSVPDVISFHPKFSGVLLGYSKVHGLSFVNLYTKKQIMIDNQIVDNDGTLYNSKSIIWSSDGRFFALIPSNHNEVVIYEFQSNVGDNFDESEDVSQAKFTIQKYNSIKINAKIGSAVIAMLPFNERTKAYLIIAVDNSIHGYDVDTQSLVWKFEGHTKSATQLCMMNYEHLPVLLSVSDEFLYVWMFPVYDPITNPAIINKFACFKAPFVYVQDPHPCQSIAFAGGRLFACSQGEGTVVELDYVQGTIMRRFHGLSATQSTQLNVNSRFIVTNGAHNVKFWSTESTASSTVEAGRKIDSIALSGDGKYLAIVSLDASKEKFVNIYSKE